jgi:5-methylcytosine-specific restriction protein A
MNSPSGPNDLDAEHQATLSDNLASLRIELNHYNCQDFLIRKISMAVTNGHGNPKWTEEETILALDLYNDLNGEIPHPTDERIHRLSEILRGLDSNQDHLHRPSLRNADGVAFKLQNIRQVATGKGLSNFSQMDKKVWEIYGGEPEEVKRKANEIRAAARV